MGKFFSKIKNEQIKQEELLQKKENDEKYKKLEEKFKKQIDGLKKYSEKNSKIIEKIKNKDLTIILGNPGSGKSTLINYLLGSNLKSEIQIDQFSKIIKVKENEKEFSKIKHQNSEIENFFFFFENENFNLLDCQGFLESNGIEFQISFVLMLLRVIENCKKVKFIFTIDFYSLNTQTEKEIFEFIEKLFINTKNLENFKNSVMILITKEKKNISIDKIKEVFKYSKDITKNKLINRLFFYQPLNLNQITKNEFIQNIKDMTFIYQKNIVVPFNIKEKYYLNKIFKHYICKIKLNFEFFQNEKLIENYEKISIFQNSKNYYLNNNIKNKIDCHLHDYFNELVRIIKELLDLERFESCKSILKHLNYIFDKNEKFKNGLDKLKNLLEQKKKGKTEKKVNDEEEEFKKIKEEEVEKKETNKEKIQKIKLEFENKKLKEIKDFQKTSKKIEISIKTLRKKKNYQKLLNYAKYLKNKQEESEKFKKDLKKNYQNKIKNVEKSSFN